MKDLFDEDLSAFSQKATGLITTHHQGHAVATGKRGHYPSCYESHPGLLIGGTQVFGGSASWPIVKDADIYIGLDSSMSFRNPARFPWHPEKHDGPVEVLFRIPDAGVPADAEEFKAMIVWLAVQLAAGKKIHVGCIGGHGRTGMVLAALVRQVDGTEDAITYVRQHYCHKAVESVSQVRFLHKHFGIKEVDASRSGFVHLPAQGRHLLKTAAEVDAAENGHVLGVESAKAARAKKPIAAPTPLAQRRALPDGPFMASPVASLSSVWGKDGKTVKVRSAALLDKPAKSASM